MNPHSCERRERVHSRREFLARSAFGFGALGLGGLLERDRAFSSVLKETPSAANLNPLLPKPPNFPAQAQSVIFIFLQGGLSHVDSFDPKPELNRFDGQLLPDSFRSQDLSLQFIDASKSKLMGVRFPFQPRGQSGLEISDLFNHLSERADDLAIIRSCYHDSFIHGPALNFLYTGSPLSGHPSVGAWILYGLGSECDNLPSYIVMSDGGISGRLNKRHFGAGYLPAVYQGTLMRTEGAPLSNLSPPPEIAPTDQRILLDQVGEWNQRHYEDRVDDSRLAARIANYELAFRMQTAAPEIIDLSGEPENVKQIYGIGEERTDRFGRMCLLARRLVGAGVRMVQLTSADWDGHGECDKNHTDNAAKIDKPIAGLLADLKQQGLLDQTLVVLTSEFGRTPVMQGVNGRDHNPYGFSSWMAGGGVRGGKIIGATDDFGFAAVEDKVHVHDLHATMLSLLGLDFKNLTYLFEGRDRRLTDIGGENNLAPRLLV